MAHERDEAIRWEDDYWDAIVRGESPTEARDAGIAEGIARTHAMDDATGPDRSFVERLKQDLIEQTIALRSSSDQEMTLAMTTLNGHVRPHPRMRTHESKPVAGGRWFRGRPAVARFAAILLLLALLTGGGFAIHSGLPGLRDDIFGSIPAPQVSPAPSPATTSSHTLAFLWETRGDPAAPMGSAPIIAIAPDGTIWMADETSDKIRIFSPDGMLLDVWGGPGTGEGRFDFTKSPTVGTVYGSIAFDAAGNVYVLDPGNHRIQKFGPDRGFLTAWGSAGTGDGQFVEPTDIAVDAQGRIVVVDSGRFRPGQSAANAKLVEAFDGEGRFLFDWGAVTFGAEPGKLMNPLGIGVDPDGTILLADAGAGIIQRFTPEGQYFTAVGGFGPDEGQFYKMKDVAIDEQGRIYATDWAKHRITVLDRDGRLLASWGDYGTGPGQLHFPYGIALDGKGNIYVTDDTGRLQKFRLPPLPVSAATPAT